MEFKSILEIEEYVNKIRVEYTMAHLPERYEKYRDIMAEEDCIAIYNIMLLREKKRKAVDSDG